VRAALAPAEYARFVERTVDGIRTGMPDGSTEDVQRILAEVRKQYDDVHSQADKRQQELLEVRREINLVEAQHRKPSDNWRGPSRDALTEQMDKVAADVDEAVELNHVYQHMVARLNRELNIVQHKVKIMEEHLRRKTAEIDRKQDSSRRLHQEKVACINELEAMEQEVEAERQLCDVAIEDLEATSRLWQDDVRHREDFERWRYDVAMEAANEAFQATAGRYWKIYAIEKLTGNCLQKITFEQLEHSQQTEDGFQKIREVTGLTDVMDIVHKFLNREMEQEQLRTAVREAELKLHGLREAEASRRGEGKPLELPTDVAIRPRGLHTEVAENEHQLANALRDHEEFEKRLQHGGMLFDSIRHWAEKLRRSFSSFEQLAPVDCPADVAPFFAALSQTIDRFFAHAHSQMAPSKLAKLTCQAGGKEYAEQQKLLGDKEFMRMNCRVPATLDSHRHTDDSKRAARSAHVNEEERQEADHEFERQRMKSETLAKLGEKDPRPLRKNPRADIRRDMGRRRVLKTPSGTDQNGLGLGRPSSAASRR